MMKLILNGDAMNRHGSRQGIYILREKLVNNHPYWEQQNGGNAIWFKGKMWYIAEKQYLGRALGWITGPKGKDRSPTKIVNGWKYFVNGIWKEAATSEIMIKDLSPGMIY